MTPEHASQATLEEIKHQLQIPYVMEHYGHEPVEVSSDGRIHYVNPFRDDTRPSFDVFTHQISGRDRPEPRWGDYAEQKQGDVVDLIERFEPGYTRAQAIDHARTLLRLQVTGEWDGPTITAKDREAFDVEAARDLFARGLPVGAGTAWDELVRTRPALRDVDIEAIRNHPDIDALMFLVYDRDGEHVGLRFRRADGSKFSMRGSHNAFLRMQFPDPSLPVFLTEGESDTWAAWAHLPDYEVLGVPGVGMPPAVLAGDELDGRTVYICFDPDGPGLAGTERWAEYLRGRGCHIRPIILPEGTDVASLLPEQVAALPSQARSFLERPAGITRDGAAFATVDKDGQPVRISNWSFWPTMRLRSDDDTISYRGWLSPHDREVVLPSIALRNGTALQQWMGQYDLAWWGTAAQQQLLIALLAHEAALAPEGRYTTQFGLTEGTFVWSGGSIGGSSVEYLPPQYAAAGTGRFSISPRPVNRPAVFEALYQLQTPSVMGPMLAWLAVAPLRTRFREFPILSVHGPSGTGKTSLLEAVGAVTYGGLPTINLTSSTPYGVESFIDQSNGFPIWIDEYRPGARIEAKLRLDQLLRDLFTGQSSMKGGVANNQVRLHEIRTVAPLIVSGEDRFTETSHVDRMVLIRLTKEGQGSLRQLGTVDAAGWGHDYLTFLTEYDPREHDPVPPVFATPWLDSRFDDRLHSRQALTMAVLRYGWMLLGEYVTDRGRNGYEMPDLVLDAVVNEAIEEGKESPIIELIRLAYENRSQLRHPAVWIGKDGKLVVNSANLLVAHKQYPHVVLPVSSARGVSSLLVDAHGGRLEKRTMPVGGQQARVVVLERSAILEDDDPVEDEDSPA